MSSSNENKSQKQQAAIEYLITHAWAILVIALVLVALFELGLFTNSYSVRAQPGACSVLRPLGPGTITAITMQGECDSAYPQYVVSFIGANSYFLIDHNIQGAPSNSVAVS